MSIGFLLVLGERLAVIQSRLNFEGWERYPQFANEKGIGRVALVASVLSLFLGMHVVLFIQLMLSRFGILSCGTFDHWPDDIFLMVTQWTVYIISLCAFHLGEFFTTVLFNPTVASSDSFMVNHSKAYTSAALFSWIEFFVRFVFFPNLNSTKAFYAGLTFVAGGQICRSLAMVTCGESFNHYIQRDKKDNHILVTHGVYSYFRHPSYLGFYYWAVGTQLILCNPISAPLYGFAAWTFFRYRIAYEETTLREMFPGAYEEYASKTYIGIPFIYPLRS